MDLTSLYPSFAHPLPSTSARCCSSNAVPNTPSSRTRPNRAYRAQTPTAGVTPHPIQRLSLHHQVSHPQVLPYYTVRYPYTQTELPSKSAVSSVGLGYPIRHRGSGAEARLTSRGAGGGSHMPRVAPTIYLTPSNFNNTATQQDLQNRRWEL